MPLVVLEDGERSAPLPPGTIGVLPVAATEAHGPHLPATTDCDIAEGHLRALPACLPAHLRIALLPLQRVGASLEHAGLPGTESDEPAVLLERWFGLAEGFAARGGRKLAVVSSHGGNSPVVDSLILKARHDLKMLAVGTGWLRFGQPEGLFSEDERRYGIHGGAVETALMLHYAPEKVARESIADFPSRLPELEAGMTHLSAYGRHRFGWLSTDLHPQGVVGNAAGATAEMGARSAAHALAGFVALLEDMDRFDPGWFGGAP